MAGLSTLVDEFSTGSVPDSGRWPTTYGDSVTVSGGQLLISCTTNFAGCISVANHTFDSVSVEAFPPALNGASSDCYGTIMVFSDAQADGTSVGFYISRIDGLIYAVNWSGFFDGSAVSETYNATNHAWLHCRYTGSAVIWERSATLTGTRTTMRTLNSPPAWITASDIGLYFDTHRDAGSNNNYAIGAVNPPTTVTGTAAAPLGALTATAAGGPSTPGTAVAALGALTATAAGSPATAGTAAAPLGSLTATASGTPSDPPAAPRFPVVPLPMTVWFAPGADPVSP
jgi:hypothetical protein